MSPGLFSRLVGAASASPSEGSVGGADPTPPDDLAGFFSSDHRACDAGWAAVEEAAEGGAVADVRAAFDRFAEHVRRHLDMEEQVLFPAFEDATGMHGVGPTAVMRMEHQQMRALLERIGSAAQAGDVAAVLAHGDTLLMLTQQHNRKEEAMLYPMADTALAAEWPGIREALSRFD